MKVAFWLTHHNVFHPKASESPYQPKQSPKAEPGAMKIMAKKRKAWVKGPEKKTTSSMSDPLKAEGESKAAGLIENVLKPKHILPPKEGTQFNYITDIGTKWYRNDFSFISTYTCPGPNATSPTFEEKFARMEHLGNDKFTLSDMRHTEAWVCLFDNLSVDDCMKSIQNDPWFMP